MIQPTKNIDLSFNGALPQLDVFIYLLPHYIGHNRDTVTGNTGRETREEGRHATNVPIMYCSLTDSSWEDFCCLFHLSLLYSLQFLYSLYKTPKFPKLTPNYCSAITLSAFSKWISAGFQHTQATADPTDALVFAVQHMEGSYRECE